MSTILKALRRLEEDKRARAAMSLDQAVLEPAVPQRSRNLWVGLGAGIAASLGAIAIAWSLSSLWLPGARSPMVAAEPSQPRAGGEAEAAALAGAPERTFQPIVPADPAASPGAGQPPAASLHIEPSTAASRMEVFAKAQEVRREMQRLADAPVEGAPGADANTNTHAEAVAAGATTGDVAAASVGVRRAPSATAPERSKNAPKVKRDVLAARQERAKGAAAPEPAAAVSASPPAVAVQKPPAVAVQKSPAVAVQKSPAVAVQKSPAVAVQKPPAVAVQKSVAAGSGSSAGVAAQKSAVAASGRSAVAAEPSSTASTKSASGSSVASKSGSSASAAATVPKVAVVERASDAVLSVKQIIWHPTPNRRVAVLQVEGDSSPRRVGEGDVVAGFTVAKIGLSDVELVRDGVTVTRRLGSSSK